MRRRHLTSAESWRLAAVVLMMGPLALGTVGPSASGVQTAPEPDAEPLSPTTTAAVRRSDLPRGWTAVRAADGRVTLRWSAAHALPVTDAGLAVYAGSTRLGLATVRGRSASLTVTTLPAKLSGLQVRAGRVSAATAAATLAASPAHRPGYHPVQSSTKVAAPRLPADLSTRRTVPVTSFDYTLPSLTVAQMPTPIQMSGHVVAPVRTSSAPRPVVVFVHGRHAWCYGGTLDTDWAYPCTGRSKPIPSKLGYDYAQRALAARGYITVSVDLNGVNAQDGDLLDGGAAARSAVVRRHLNVIAGWQSAPGTAPAGFRRTVGWNLTKVVLIGHSRGGEGVDRAAADVNVADPFRVAGLVLWAPVNFARQTAAATPTVTLLPGCDGDVSDLQGQIYTDRALDAGAGAALHTSTYLPGANHNFLNTEWTPGISVAPSYDDGYWTSCPEKARTTPAQERSLGAAYTLAAVRAVIDRDATAARYLDGSTTLPTGLGAAVASSVPVAGDRQLLWRGNAVGTPTATLTSATLCIGRLPRHECPGSLDVPVSPHWLTTDARSAPSAVLRFASAQSAAGLTWTTPVDVSTSTSLEARVAVAPATITGLRVRLTDTGGHSVLLTPDVGARLTGLPSAKVVDDAVGRYLGQLVRVPLAAASGLDLAHLTSFQFVSLHASRVLTLLDVSASRPGAGAPAPADPLPRLDFAASDMTVAEGPANHVVQLRLGLNRPVSAPVNVVVSRNYVVGGPVLPLTTLTIPPGATSVLVSMAVEGNTLDDTDLTAYDVSVEPHGLLGVGQGSLLLFVQDDDPMPTLSVEPALASAREGAALTWTFKLNTPSHRVIDVYVEAQPVSSELRGVDLTVRGREDWAVRDGAMVLSAYPAMNFFVIPDGATRFTVTLPIRKDGVAEGTERARFSLATDKAVIPAGTLLVGSVRD